MQITWPVPYNLRTLQKYVQMFWMCICVYLHVHTRTTVCLWTWGQKHLNSTPNKTLEQVMTPPSPPKKTLILLCGTCEFLRKLLSTHECTCYFNNSQQFNSSNKYKECSQLQMLTTAYTGTCNSYIWYGTENPQMDQTHIKQYSKLVTILLQEMCRKNRSVLLICSTFNRYNWKFLKIKFLKWLK
jgi:hypothetical protein